MFCNWQAKLRRLGLFLSVKKWLYNTVVLVLKWNSWTSRFPWWSRMWQLLIIENNLHIFCFVGRFIGSLCSSHSLAKMYFSLFNSKMQIKFEDYAEKCCFWYASQPPVFHTCSKPIEPTFTDWWDDEWRGLPGDHGSPKSPGCPAGGRGQGCPSVFLTPATPWQSCQSGRGEIN